MAVMRNNELLPNATKEEEFKKNWRQLAGRPLTILQVEIMDNQNNRVLPSPALPSALKDQGRHHANHSILWGLNSNNLIKMTCDRAGTIEDSLKRSAQFRKITGKNKDKELVIMRNNRAISKHFPCTLINKEDRLTVKFVKAVEPPKKPVGAYVSLCKNKPASELVSFHVVTKGGKDIVKILNNRALRAVADEITIYAYKGEKVKHALKRDGRLLGNIFRKNFVLLNRSTQVKTELSNIVDELNDETFQITLLDKSSPPQSLSGSLDEAYLLTNENQSQSESENDNTIKQECNDNITSGNVLLEIPNSKSMKSQLCSRFEESVKALKSLAPNPSHIQNWIRVNFGQSAQMCHEVKAMKKLMDLSDSVCQVRINGVPNGTGFLLFGRYVLTNGHVIQNIYNEKGCKLIPKVSVHFSYDSVEQTDGALDVVEVVGIECSPEVPGGDWALLKLRDNQKLATALLKHSGFLPSDGGICIIGHPDGGVKKINPCLIVPSHSRIQVANRHHRENLEHVQLIGNSFFENVAKSIHQKSFLTYESCFYHKSSGSPVFDKHSDVVAVHSGGYIYESARGEIQSVIEFAHPLPAIMERFIIQMVERQNYDVLKEYLACSYALHENVMDGVKNLVERGNLVRFKNAVNNFFAVADQIEESLYRFFEFFQKNEPIPMDIC